MSDAQTLLKFVQYLSNNVESDSVEKALSKRLSLVFGQQVAFNISGNGRLTCYTTMSDPRFNENQWKETTTEGMWELRNSVNLDNIDSIIDLYENEFGSMVMYFPAMSHFENLIESIEDDPEMIDEPELIKEVSSILEGKEVHLLSGEQLLPPNSDFLRFSKMVSTLESEGWLGIWDECCWNCAKSVIESEHSVDDPFFIVYGQNADYVFTPEGEMLSYTFKLHPNGNEREIQLARDNKFEIKIESDGLITLIGSAASPNQSMKG
jgi:hypothetical protein